MGLLIFLFLIGALSFKVIIGIAIGGLFFGGDDEDDED